MTAVMTVLEPLGGLPNEAWRCEEGDVTVNGVRLHYLDARRPNVDPADAGRTLVMLHGMTSHSDAWRPVIAAMSAVERVICVDFRGHGQSEWTREGYWLADYSTDVIGLVDALGVNRFGLVGQSLGARVSMVLGARLGARLEAMVLCDTGPEVARSAAEQARGAFLSSKRVTAFNTEAELLSFLRSEQPEWADVSIEVRAARLYRRNWAGKLINRGDPDVGWLLGRAGLKEMDDMWNGLQTTPAPTLVVRGTRSYLLSAEIAEKMCAALAKPTYLEMPYGHYIPYEAPTELAAAIDSFLRMQNPSPAHSSAQPHMELR